VFQANGSLLVASPFPPSGPSQPGSPISQVLCRRYDFPLAHTCSLMVSVAGSTRSSFVRARRGALDGLEGTRRAWDVCSAGVPCSGLLRSWTSAGSLRFPGDPSRAFALLQDPGRAGKASPVAALSILPPVPTNRRPQRAHDLEAATGLQRPPPTLHERRCRRPCKAGFRLAGCAFAGRGSNPLDRFERFQFLSFLLSRTSPDASWVHAERLVHRLDTFTDLHRAAQQRIRALIWGFYADLKAYPDYA
jgi:hypothetical protein